MKAKIDKVQKGRKKVVGLVMKIEGRIRGSSRSRKIVYTWGKQGQQDRLNRIHYAAGAVNTRYGTLGLKIQSAIKRIKATNSRRKARMGKKATLKQIKILTPQLIRTVQENQDGINRIKERMRLKIKGLYQQGKARKER